MSEDSEPIILDQLSVVRTNEREPPMSVGGALLAAGWIIVPAAQYYGTSERTRFQTGEAGDPAEAPALVQWDLTPAYLLLVLLTVLHVFRAFVSSRSNAGAEPDMETAQVTGGTA